MTASGTAHVPSLLNACLRVLAAVVALLLLLFAIRGRPVPLERLGSVPQSVGDMVTTSTNEAASQARPVPRGQLRREFQELFAHHATLVVRFMRSTVVEDPGFVEAANAVLIRNTDDLRATLAQVAGADQASAFARAWQSQIQALYGYAAALRDDDAGAANEARAQLRAAVDEQAALLVRATNGRLDRKTTSASLRTQADLLLHQIDAYAHDDYRQAYELEREAYTHMRPFAASLAAAATGDPDGGPHPAPLQELTARLSTLLGMHVELSVDALRTGASGADEFAAAADALDANSHELSATFDALLGTRPSRRLGALWADQTDLLMRYAVAIAESEPSERHQAREGLRTMATRFERQLRAATPDDADASAAAQALRAQQVLLLDQLDAYVGGGQTSAHDIAYTAHHRAPDLAHALARAFVTGLPRGGAPTGGGGAAMGSTIMRSAATGL